MFSPRRLLTIGGLASLVVTSPARASDEAPVEEARAAYRNGARAYDAGDYPAAAAAFAEADALVPNRTALELALRSASRADDAVLAMTLADRAEERVAKGPSGGLGTLVSQVRLRFRERAGFLTVSCAVPCDVRVDGTALAAGQGRWLTIGAHELETSTGGGSGPSERSRIELRPRERVTVRLDALTGPPNVVPTVEAPAPSAGALAAPDTAAAAAGRPAKIAFWAGVSTTVALGVATLVSALDVRSQREEFDRDPTPPRAEDGRAAQVRTNVLVASTAIVGAGTVLVGAFWVRW